MSKFAINKDFDSAKADIGDSGDTLEIVRLGKEDFGVFYIGKDGNTQEYGCYTLDELKAIYWILSK
jgi:hypothetical protein